MTLTQAQKDKFIEWQGVIAALTIADLEASTWTLVQEWNLAWFNYIKSGTAPGFDRPPTKPPHP